MPKSARIVGTLIDTIGNEIKRGRTVQITGFGTFSTVKRKARKGRNPKTGEPIKIAAMTLPKFSAGKALKDLVSEEEVAVHDAMTDGSWRRMRRHAVDHGPRPDRAAVAAATAARSTPSNAAGRAPLAYGEPGPKRYVPARGSTSRCCGSDSPRAGRALARRSDPRPST
ncbi:MAG: HU family DNA-binding protein [Comamonadaceae bacterium]|nr:HU family DNA-binding protein [Comamonadaceae bacterium]